MHGRSVTHSWQNKIIVKEVLSETKNKTFATPPPPFLSQIIPLPPPFFSLSSEYITTLLLHQSAISSTTHRNIEGSEVPSAEAQLSWLIEPSR